MVIDELPQWFERFFVFFALIMMLGICNACSHLAGIGRQLEDLGRYLDGLDSKNTSEALAEMILVSNEVRDELHDIRRDVEKIVDPEEQKRRMAATYGPVMKRSQSHDW